MMNLWDWFQSYLREKKETVEEYLDKVSTPAPRTRPDRDIPNLFVGKVISDNGIVCEVISYTENEFRVKMLENNWDRLGTYLDMGETYPLRLCYDSQDGGMLVWEIEPETMKRDFSQVLLAWERDIGWSWDIDS